MLQNIKGGWLHKTQETVGGTWQVVERGIQTLKKNLGIAWKLLWKAEKKILEVEGYVWAGMEQMQRNEEKQP